MDLDKTKGSTTHACVRCGKPFAVCFDDEPNRGRKH
jgi:hypothetical protein